MSFFRQPSRCGRPEVAGGRDSPQIGSKLYWHSRSVAHAGWAGLGGPLTHYEESTRLLSITPGHDICWMSWTR